MVSDEINFFQVARRFHISGIIFILFTALGENGWKRSRRLITPHILRFRKTLINLPPLSLMKVWFLPTGQSWVLHQTAPFVLLNLPEAGLTLAMVTQPFPKDGIPLGSLAAEFVSTATTPPSLLVPRLGARSTSSTWSIIWLQAGTSHQQELDL